MKQFISSLLLVCISVSAFAALPSFNAINVSGPINLIIQGTSSKYPKSTAVLSHNSKAVNVKVKNNTLFIRSLNTMQPTKKSSTVRVRMYRLNTLSAYGKSSVTANNIKSDGLSLLSDTMGNITLNGSLAVNQITNYAPNRITIRWVSSKSLTIHSTSGRITLAGSVAELHVRLRNHAILNAKYLRAQRVLIQAKGFSIANVLPILSLRAFVSGHANVYFYKTPEHISRYTTDSGNVLQLGDIN